MKIGDKTLSKGELVAGIFGLLVILGMLLPDSSTAPSGGTAASKQNLITSNPEQFQVAVMEALGEHPAWDNVEFKIQERGVSASLYYKNTQHSMSTISNDTKQINRAILGQLVKEGRKPASEWLSVHVHAYSREAGETGTPLVRVYGSAHYDFNNDSIAFEAEK